MRQRDIKLAWKQSTEEKFARGAEGKQEIAQVRERKRLLLSKMRKRCLWIDLTD